MGEMRAGDGTDASARRIRVNRIGGPLEFIGSGYYEDAERSVERASQALADDETLAYLNLCLKAFSLEQPEVLVCSESCV